MLPKIIKKINGIFAAVIFLFIFAVPVLGENTASIVVNTIYSEKPVSNFCVKLVKAGEYRDGDVFLISPFDTLNLEYKDGEILLNRNNANLMSKASKRNKLKGVSLKTNKEGKAVFENLENGIYIIEENKTSEYIMSPVIVIIGAYSGNTEIEPKMEYIGKDDNPGGNEKNVTSVNITKIWNDGGDSKGIRPSSITVNLYRGKDLYKTASLTDANSYSHTFEDLPLGEVYSVEEIIPEGYIAKISGSERKGFLIMNSLSGDDNEDKDKDKDKDKDENKDKDKEEIKITVEKKWKDENDEKRPQNIIVYLISENSVVSEINLTPENNWTGAFENLSKDLLYTVYEEPVEGYSTSYESNSEGFVITNTAGDEKESENIPDPIKPNDNTNPPKDDTKPSGNDNKEPSEDEKIPQTGMLMWPIPVLMGTGVCFVVLGVILRRRKDSE